MTSGSPSESPLTPVVFHILLALEESPLHGYAVMKRVEQDAGVSMGPGTVYGSLQRLQDAGWVEPAEASEEDPRRGRTFRLTRKGRAALRKEAARLTRLARLVRRRDLVPESGGRP